MAGVDREALAISVIASALSMSSALAAGRTDARRGEGRRGLPCCAPRQGPAQHFRQLSTLLEARQARQTAVDRMIRRAIESRHQLLVMRTQAGTGCDGAADVNCRDWVISGPQAGDGGGSGVRRRDFRGGRACSAAIRSAWLFATHAVNDRQPVIW